MAFLFMSSMSSTLLLDEHNDAMIFNKEKTGRYERNGGKVEVNVCAGATTFSKATLYRHSIEALLWSVSQIMKVFY